MTFFSVKNTRVDNRLYSVTGAFDLNLRTPCFYPQHGYKTMHCLTKKNAFKSIVADVNRDFIKPNPGITTLIPIDPPPKLTALQHPAVSSLEAYPTPAR